MEEEKKELPVEEAAPVEASAETPTVEESKPEKKKMKKGAKVAIIVGASVVGFVAVFFAGVEIYFRAPVANYYRNSEKAFKIPGVDDGLIQQGLSYDAATNDFYVCGYKSSGASQVATVNKTTKATKYVNLKNADGSDNTSHAGGLTVYGDYVYVANGGKVRLDVYSKADIQSATDGAYVTALGTVNLKWGDDDMIKPSWTTVHDGNIVIGEFYDGKTYKTTDSHALAVEGGTYNAVGVEFAFDPSATATFGINLTPVKAYALENKVQGLAFDSDTMYTSISWGPAFSHFNMYRTATMANKGNVTINGTSVAYYAADSTAKYGDILVPPMSEEIEIVDGKMYCMCESASNKYIFGKFTGGKWCYATNLAAYK